MVQHLRKRYPKTQIMWKPAHLRSMNAHTGKAGEGMTGSSDVEQINQSTRILMHKLGVPVLECKSRPSTQSVRQLTS
jgi:IS5 family transposase